MASKGFLAIVADKLGLQMTEGTQAARIEEIARQKGLELQAMYTVRTDDYMEESDIQVAEDAAEAAVEARLAEMAEQTVESLLSTNKTKKEKGKLKVKAPGLLRGRDGRIMSAFNLATILNLVLYKYVQALMGKEGRLVNRTGRLAHSGEVVEIKQVGTEKVSFMFKYMTYPYAVFEPGGRMGSVERSPKELFTQAIRDALQDILSPRGSVLERNRIIGMKK